MQVAEAENCARERQITTNHQSCTTRLRSSCFQSTFTTKWYHTRLQN